MTSACNTLVQKVVSEHATSDVLTNCLLDSDEAKSLLGAWGETQKILSESKVSLNPLDCLRYKLNEICENKVIRLVQLYELVRWRKLFENSKFILELQASNANVKLISDEERTLAERWKSYLQDHDWILQENKTHFVHFSPASEQLDLATYKRMLDPDNEEDDPAVAKIIEEAQKYVENEQTPLPYHITQCHMQESLRQGFYKGRFKAQL